MRFKINDRVRVKDGVLNAGEAGTVIRVHGFRPPGVDNSSREWSYGVLLDGRNTPTGYDAHELILQPLPLATKPEMVNHPAHYGGGDNPFEVYKVLDAWGLIAFAYLWNAVKYIARCNLKGNAIEDLKKARWYIDREIERREREVTKEKA